MGKRRIRNRTRTFFYWISVEVPRFVCGRVPSNVYFRAMRYRWLIAYGLLSYKWLILK